MPDSPWKPLPGLSDTPERGDSSVQAIRAGVGAGLTCAAIATLMFNILGWMFMPLPLLAWPGALGLGAGLGWFAGKGAPRWVVVLAGGVIPVANTLVSALLWEGVNLLRGDSVREWGRSFNQGTIGPAITGLAIFSPLLFPLGLAAGWFIHRAVVRAMRVARQAMGG